MNIFKLLGKLFLLCCCIVFSTVALELFLSAATIKPPETFTVYDRSLWAELFAVSLLFGNIIAAVCIIQDKD